MYAIAFDLDYECLRRHYNGSAPNHAYDDIRRVLESFGFWHQQGSLYFGDAKKVDSVTCVLAVQEIGNRHPWFKRVVNDIRMLRIEDNNDLMPAVGDLELPLEVPKSAAE